MVPAEEQKALKFPRYLRKDPKASGFDFETAWEHLHEKALNQIGERPKENYKLILGNGSGGRQHPRGKP